MCHIACAMLGELSSGNIWCFLQLAVAGTTWQKASVGQARGRRCHTEDQLWVQGSNELANETYVLSRLPKGVSPSLVDAANIEW